MSVFLDNMIITILTSLFLEDMCVQVVLSFSGQDNIYETLSNTDYVRRDTHNTGSRHTY